MKQKTNEKLRNLEKSDFGNDDENPNWLAKSEEIIAKLMNPSGKYSYKVLLTFYESDLSFLNET